MHFKFADSTISLKFYPIEIAKDRRTIISRDLLTTRLNWNSLSVFYIANNLDEDQKTQKQRQQLMEIKFEA